VRQGGIIFREGQTMNIRHRVQRVSGPVVVAILLLFAGSQAAPAAGVSWTAASTVASSGRTACDHSQAASTSATGTSLHVAWRGPSAGYTIDPPLIY
jgi:hypothetical protein